MTVMGRKVVRYWTKGPGYCWRQCSIRWSDGDLQMTAIGAMRNGRVRWQLEASRSASASDVRAAIAGAA